MKQFISAAVLMVFLAVFALPQIVVAGEDGFFIGASLGYAEVGADLDFIDDKGSFDESDMGYKIFGGLKWGILGVEGGYVNFGTPDGTVAGKDGEVELDGFDLFGMLILPIGPFDLFGKLGGFYWDSDFSGTDLLKGGDDGFDVAGGVGAAFNLGHFGIRAEVEYFDVSGRMDGATLVSAGVVYTF